MLDPYDRSIRLISQSLNKTIHTYHPVRSIIFFKILKYVIYAQFQEPTSQHFTYASSPQLLLNSSSPKKLMEPLKIPKFLA